MRTSSDYDKAKEIYEQAMEVVHSHIGDVVDHVDELSVLLEKFEKEIDRDKADELISKILTSLDRI